MLQTMTFLSRSFLVANSFLLLSASSVLAQALPPPPSDNNTEYEFEAPSDSPSPDPSPPNEMPEEVPSDTSPQNNHGTFRVQVHGTSDELLSVIRRVEPEAFVRRGENVIQVGLFSDQAKANSIVEELAEEGIEAEVVTIEGSQNQSSSRETISLSPADESDSDSSDWISITTQPPSADSDDFQTTDAPPSTSQDSTTPREANPRAYYVVIPGNQEQISRMAQRAEQAGVSSDLILQRDAPRGTHVAVGPFENRHEASRWNEQLRSEGLDRARVYFGR